MEIVNVGNSAFLQMQWQKLISSAANSVTVSFGLFFVYLCLLDLKNLINFYQDMELLTNLWMQIIVQKNVES